MGIHFAPSVYEHAAALIGETPWRVSRDPEFLFRAHAEAFRLYRHSPVVVGIDIYNLEAEAYGATIATPAGNDIPSICVHPCPASDGIVKLNLLDPKRAGRIPMVIETGRRLARALPEADIRIPVSGSFSLACNLVGFEDGINFWGGSEIVSPDGTCMVSAKLFEEDLIVADIDENDMRRSRRLSRHFLDDDPGLVERELKRMRGRGL